MIDIYPGPGNRLFAGHPLRSPLPQLPYSARGRYICVGACTELDRLEMCESG